MKKKISPRNVSRVHVRFWFMCTTNLHILQKFVYPRLKPTNRQIVLQNIQLDSIAPHIAILRLWHLRQPAGITVSVPLPSWRLWLQVHCVCAFVQIWRWIHGVLLSWRCLPPPPRTRQDPPVYRLYFNWWSKVARKRPILILWYFACPCICINMDTCTHVSTANKEGGWGQEESVMGLKL